MANYDTDSEASYHTDYSNVNFIPGFIMENSETIECSDSNSDEDTGIAYTKEPLADEEWLANYHAREREQLDSEEKLTQRLNGSVELNKW